MSTVDEENYKEAMEASFKVFSPVGIGKYIYDLYAVSETHTSFFDLV